MAAAGEVGTEASLLNNDGTARGEITAAPVAEPTGVKTDVLVLRDGEFAFRAADVIAIELVIGAEIVRSVEAQPFGEFSGSCRL